MMTFAFRGKVARSVKWLAAMAIFAALAALNAAPLDARGFTSLGNLAITSETLTFDTDALTVTGGGPGLTSTTGVLQAQPGIGSPQVAVFAFDNVSVGAAAIVVVTGSRPVAILSRNDVAIAANLQFDGADGTTGGGGTAGPNGVNGGPGNSAGSSGGLGGVAPVAIEKGGNGGRGGYDQQYGERGQDGSGGALGGPGGAYADGPVSTSQGGTPGGNGAGGIMGTLGSAAAPTTFANLVLRNGTAGGAGTAGTNGRGGGGGGGAGGVNGIITDDKRGAGGGSGGGGGTGGELGGGGKGAQSVEIGAVNSVTLSNSFQARGGPGGSGGTGGSAGAGSSGGPPSDNSGPGGNGGPGGRGGDGGPGAGGSGGIIYVHGNQIVPPRVVNVLGGAGGTNSSGAAAAPGGSGTVRLEGTLVLHVNSETDVGSLGVYGSADYVGKVLFQVADDALADEFATTFRLGDFFRVAGAPVPGNDLFGNTTFEVQSPNRFYRATADSAGFFTLSPAQVESELIALTGQPVPGAGGADVPPKATWVSFGAPTLNDAGTVAFTGKWKSPDGTGGGIFSNDVLRVKLGALVPGAGSGSLPEGAFFKILGDPVIDGDGALTFFATIGGAKLPASQAAAVCSVSAAGVVSIVARAGDDAPGTGGATFKKFYSISREGGAILIHAAVSGRSATPPVTASNDTGVWKWVGGVGTLFLREGDLIGGKPVKSFAMLANSGLTRGQGRWHVGVQGASDWLCTARVTFDEGTHALLTGSQSDQLSNTVVAGTGMEVTSLGASGLPGAKWASFGFPAISADGLSLGTLATLEIGAGDVTSANDTAIFSGPVMEVRLREGDFLPGVNDAKFVSFQDPVFAADGEFAIVAVSKSTEPRAKPSTGIWSSVGLSLQLLARIGGPVDATAGSPTWKSFSSLVVPAGDRGPLFAAKVKGKSPTVTAKNDQGVWGVNSEGELVQVLREGDVIEGKSVLAFTALGAVDGAKEVGRCWNNEGEIVWRATFKQKQQAVVITRIP